jgi:hypothetical protein
MELQDSPAKGANALMGWLLVEPQQLLGHMVDEDPDDRSAPYVSTQRRDCGLPDLPR